MIEWAYFPRNQKITPLGRKVVEVFEAVAVNIDSKSNNEKIKVGFTQATSDVVLSQLRKGLEAIGFKVEGGKKTKQKISVPVLFGRDGRAARTFDADAYHEAEGFVLEVEAG